MVILLIRRFNEARRVAFRAFDACRLRRAERGGVTRKVWIKISTASDFRKFGGSSSKYVAGK
jgi:hypothetical protein